MQSYDDKFDSMIRNRIEKLEAKNAELLKDRKRLEYIFEYRISPDVFPEREWREAIDARMEE